MDPSQDSSSHIYLVGQQYTFEDGNWLKVTQIKRRDDGYWVTYLVRVGPGIPRMHVSPVGEFMQTYSHLFTQNS
jgi:hypothetical protein